MLSVKTKDILDMLPTRMETENEYALVEEDKKMYQYKNGQWEPVKFNGGKFSMTLKELNASIFEQLEPMTPERLDRAQSEVFQFLGATMNWDKPERNYWALICWDKHYITIFHNDETNDESLSDIFMEILEGLGQIKDITVNEDSQSIEVWITDESGTYCYVFFDYTAGVVEGAA